MMCHSLFSLRNLQTIYSYSTQSAAYGVHVIDVSENKGTYFQGQVLLQATQLAYILMYNGFIWNLIEWILLRIFVFY